MSAARLAPPPGPPHARLAFRVGVVGHRPDRLQHADPEILASVIRTILTLIRQEVVGFRASHPGLFGEGGVVLRAVSPLAEGSDRLFAREAIDLGYELCCPLPFSQVEYERDFEPGQALESNSLEHFRELIDRAAERTRVVRFEMDGDRADAAAAYAAAGRVILNQADILLAVWDGERRGKQGGTETSLDQAQARGVPIIRIDARSPHDWEVHAAGSGQNDDTQARLKQLVCTLLEVPAQSGALDEFYRERRPRLNPQLAWTCFRSLFGGMRWKWPAFGVRAFEAGVMHEWTGDPSTPNGLVVERLRRYYAWTDQLAIYYSNAYRGAFLLAYGLAALAVGLALAPVAAGWFGTDSHGQETAAVVGEIAAVLLILGLVLRGRSRRWHERWIDYRLGAELIRHLRLAVPLGGERPLPEVAAHLATYGHPSATWVGWYVRAVERDLGLPDARIDAHYLRRALEELTTLLRGQARYHTDNAEHCHRIEHRLHVLGMVLLATTLLAGVIHLLGGLVEWMPHSPRISGVLISLTAFLPALGASLAGISNQGEFRRIAKRSKAMADHLHVLLGEAAATQQDSASGKASWFRIVDLTTRTTQLMVKEVLDWRVVFLDRPLNPPA